MQECRADGQILPLLNSLHFWTLQILLVQNITACSEALAVQRIIVCVNKMQTVNT